MPLTRILLWYRRDLRLHDHKPLITALQQQAEIIPLYCFDSREFTQTAFGFPKTGNFRGQFLLESVANLRRSLQQKGSNLLIYSGKPEVIISQLCRQFQIDTVYWHREVTAEETHIEKRLQKNLSQQNVSVGTFWGTTLHEPEEMPFGIPQVPEVFTQFRKTVEKYANIVQALPTPQELPPLPSELAMALGELPTLKQLGLSTPESDRRGVLAFQGGETAALERLQDYFWRGNHLKSYKQTRNGLLGGDYSSKFSPWLALGCLSARQIAAQVSRYETERVANDSTYWLIFELLWRDYFRWISAKHGIKIFQPKGLQGVKIPWKQDREAFELWRTGQTGIPFVDANMRELLQTGFMSNRGRQNVGSFLTKNLGLDWRMGAEWFESQLIDYDVCSNWGNWNYTAGVGNDARGFRYFNIPKQAKDYDPQGEYVRHWLPELKSIPGEQIHQPWRISVRELGDRHDITLGETYPKPMVDLQQSVQENERIYQKALGIQPNSSRQSKGKNSKTKRSSRPQKPHRR
ncbi:deoxyribodipyrimidine photo-lyase (single-stranded DNA-specific) [[Leptolyngbya] sp. PCC 7376]|uniref:DASH family cryptochrome n=1 Tax=[Leptolyngbya] sp. PCC 7376 TaxID=111781 RepID=UPI00029EDD04|nr:DASH family cryptochrome [[Leptolyngbya] sp. PCC 7376]AFY37250.1 deoxyribodipyrimidine photo-lyase (single-stranded DNA-specific) [[Leptolyngbya] sp. PCC 7376]